MQRDGIHQSNLQNIDIFLFFKNTRKQNLSFSLSFKIDKKYSVYSFKLIIINQVMKSFLVTFFVMLLQSDSLY